MSAAPLTMHQVAAALVARSAPAAQITAIDQTVYQPACVMAWAEQVKAVDETAELVRAKGSTS